MKKQKGIFSVMSLLIFLFLHPSFSYAESVESYRDIPVEGIIGNPSVVKNEPLVSRVHFQKYISKTIRSYRKYYCPFYFGHIVSDDRN